MATRNHNNRRKGSGRFLMLPYALTEHEAYYTLPDSAKSLLIEIARQYTGKNNGDLAATLSLLKNRGWNSNKKITGALKNLIEHGLIVQTRQGRRPRIASLYAITWQKIDSCEGKIEVPETNAPTNEWKQFRFFDHLQEVHTEPLRGSMRVVK